MLVVFVSSSVLFARMYLDDIYKNISRYRQLCGQLLEELLIRLSICSVLFVSRVGI